MRTRVIVMGASADGIHAIGNVLSRLPADFDAPVLLVQHVGRGSSGFLPSILDRAGPLPAIHPTEGQLITRGVVYVAPPDLHMTIRGMSIHLSRGPEENFARPAIDALFRSAALWYRAATIGVVLTGYLNDGTAGVAAIKDSGGVAIVEDPETASVPFMPRSVIERVPVDAVLPLDDIAGKLVELVSQAPGPDRFASSLVLEDRIAGGEVTSRNIRTLLERCPDAGRPCPLCGTTLRRLPEPRFPYYRCNTGHAFTAASQEDAMRGATLA